MLSTQDLFLNYVKSGQSSFVSELLPIQGVDVNAIDSFGKTVLHYVQDADTCQLLLNVSAKLINHKDKEGNTALHYATIGGYIPVCQKLVRAGANIEVKNNNDMLPIDYAKQYEYSELYKLLAPKQNNKDLATKIDELESENSELKAKYETLHKRFSDIRTALYH